MVYQNLIENIGVLKNIQKVRDTDLVLSLQGASVGEKVLSIKALNSKSIFIAKDLPEKINVINGLECLGIKCSEYSTDLNAPIYMPIKNNEIKTNLTKNLYDFLLNKTDRTQNSAAPTSSMIKFSEKNTLYS